MRMELTTGMNFSSFECEQDCSIKGCFMRYPSDFPPFYKENSFSVFLFPGMMYPCQNVFSVKKFAPRGTYLGVDFHIEQRQK